jgi:hypothetical protein
LYVPLVVVMLVKQLNARAMEASLAAHVVARVCIGRQDDPWPQMRDQANLARAYAALGTEGVDEITAVILPGATDLGCAEPSRLSSDTTAQAWPMGSPNEPGMVRGWAQRWGRALQKRTTWAVGGGDMALAQVETILRSVQAPHLFAKGTPEKRQGWPRLLTEVGQWVVDTRPRVARLGQSRARVTQSARATRGAMHAGAKRLIPPIVPWITTGVVAQGQIVPAGVLQARAIVRNQAGKQVECG